MCLVLQHILPKGFRRVRDYGFLRGNAKRLLQLVQMTLKVVIDSFKAQEKAKAPARLQKINHTAFAEHPPRQKNKFAYIKSFRKARACSTTG
uniref:transposase n=1 Tax=Microbulbifer elongatus TaxID=86173 RepID=UPI003898F634